MENADLKNVMAIKRYINHSAEASIRGASGDFEKQSLSGSDPSMCHLSSSCCIAPPSNREATKRIHILGQSADGIANGPAWAALTKHRLRMTRTHAEPAFAQGPEQGTAECDEPKQQPRPNVRLLGTWICNDRSACRSEQMTASSHPAEPLTNGK